MRHTCTNRRTHDMILTLPDREGRYDRFLSYHCAGCGATTDIAGSFHLRSAPWTLKEVLRTLGAERRQGTPLPQGR